MKDFKVRCIKAFANVFDVKVFTEGKMYEIKDGKLTDDKGHTYTSYLNSIEQVNIRMASKFELVEDKPSFKVRCVEPKGKRENFKLGKIYEVKDGTIVADDGFKFQSWSDSGKNSTYEEFSKWWNDDRNCSHFELVTEPKQFTKADLRTGMRVETRDGDRYTVYLGTEDGDIIQGKWWSFLNHYENDLTGNRDSSLDIVKVYSKHMNNNLSDPNKVGELLYQRAEPKKVTKAEAEKYLSDHMEESVEIVG